MKKLLIILTLFTPFFAFSALGGGTGTITQLDFWKATSTPNVGITPRTYGQDIILSGLTSGLLQIDANGLVTGGGVGSSNWATTSTDYWMTVGGNSYIHASTTIPKTYTNNTFTGINTFNATTSMLSRVLIGSDANYLDFPNAGLISSKGDSGHTYTNNIGIVGESKSVTGYPGVGVGGVAQSNGIFPAYGVAGRAYPGQSSDSGGVIGVEGLSEATHAGGSNIAFWASATSGLLNYSFYGNSGNLYNNGTGAFVGGLKVSSSDLLGDYLDVNPTGIRTPSASTTNLLVNNVATTSKLCFGDTPETCMTAPSVAGSAITLYPWNLVVDIPGYEGMRTLPDTLAEVDETCSADADVAGGYCTIDTYVSTSSPIASGALILNKIPAGTWNFNTYSYVNSATGVSKIEYTFKRRTALGVETSLFQATSTEINATAVSLTTFLSTQLNFAFDPTDRLVFVVKGWTDSGTAKTIHYVYENGSHYSNITTPITIASEAIAFLPTNNIFTGINTISNVASSTLSFLTDSLTNWTMGEAQDGSFRLSSTSVLGVGDVFKISYTGSSRIMDFYESDSSNLATKLTFSTGGGTIQTYFVGGIHNTIGSATVFNEDSKGAGYELRMEGDNDANLFYTDTANDKIGIGTTTPTSKLHVYGTGEELMLGDISASDHYVSFRDTMTGASVGYSAGTNSLRLESGVGKDVSMVVNSGIFSGGTTGLTVSGQVAATRGFIGIGTTSPLSKLTVQGTAGLANAFSVASSTGAPMFAVEADGTVRTNGTASSTSLVVSDQSLSLGGGKIYKTQHDRFGIPQATTTDETAKFGRVLSPGESITITSVDMQISSTTQTTDYSNNGITFNINIGDTMSSTAPMTAFSALQWMHGTSSTLSFTPNSTTVVPAGYSYWFTFGTASTSQIQMLNANVNYYEN